MSSAIRTANVCSSEISTAGMQMMDEPTITSIRCDILVFLFKRCSDSAIYIKAFGTKCWPTHMAI